MYLQYPFTSAMKVFVCFTHLSDFLDGRGEDIEDDHPLLRRRPNRQFHQDHVCVQHQVAQVEELHTGDEKRMKEKLHKWPQFKHKYSNTQLNKLSCKHLILSKMSQNNYFPSKTSGLHAQLVVRFLLINWVEKKLHFFSARGFWWNQFTKQSKIIINADEALKTTKQLSIKHQYSINYK